MLFYRLVLLPSLKAEFVSKRTTELIQRLLKTNVPENVKEAIGISVIGDETSCSANDFMVPVIRSILMNDQKRCLPVDRVIEFFSRCVSNQESLSLPPFLNLMRLFLKEYNTQCPPYKTVLVSILDTLKEDQPLIRVLRTIISKLWIVCKKH
ncbi:hypothetical protein WA171_006844 [Blastocystis sp. BT1]